MSETIEIALVDLSSVAYPIWHMSGNEPDQDFVSRQTVAKVRELTRTKTLVFEDGRGLTISSSGTYWIDSAADVKRAIQVLQDELAAKKNDLSEVLALAGVILQP